MTTTGELLVTLSGEPTGTAMFHLQTIEAGGGGEDIVRYVAVEASKPVQIAVSRPFIEVLPPKTAKIAAISPKNTVELKVSTPKFELKEAENAAKIR
jgi:hypothetical protein